MAAWGYAGSSGRTDLTMRTTVTRPKTTTLPAAGVMALTLFNSADAGEVKILAADFQSKGANRWLVRVTLAHADTGWDHYADDWRVVDGAGRILGDRVLLHPHVDEQPFTRGLDNVPIPEGVTTVYIEAHDKVHGWAAQRLRVDLGKVSNGHLRVETQ
jgi:hypothetical protein